VQIVAGTVKQATPSYVVLQTQGRTFLFNVDPGTNDPRRAGQPTALTSG
jgi:hypothetical protein